MAPGGKLFGETLDGPEGVASLAAEFASDRTQEEDEQRDVEEADV
jgi:hypothetical protein